MDALRGVAAIAVITGHAPEGFVAVDRHSIWLAVDFFFCLSGFVVAFSYERRLQNHEVTARAFAVLRIIRLYPLYFLATLVGIIVTTLYFPSGHGLKYVVLALTQLLMVPNYFTPYRVTPFDMPAWSLIYELAGNFFYAFLLARKFAGTRKLVVLFLVCAALRFWQIAGGSPTNIGPNSQVADIFPALLRLCASFFLGVLLLRVYRWRRPDPIHGLRAMLTAAIVVVVLAVTLISPAAILRNEAVRFAEMIVVFPILIYVSASVRLPRSTDWSCAFLGDVSYPIYLLHLPLMYLMGFVPVVRLVVGSPMHNVTALCAWILVTMVVGYCSLRIYETPARTWLRSLLLPAR